MLSLWTKWDLQERKWEIPVLKPCRLYINSALKSRNQMLKCLVLTSATGGAAVSHVREFPVMFSVPARWYLVFRNVRRVPVPTCSFMSFLRRPSAILIISCPTGHCVTYRKQGPDVQMTYRLLTNYLPKGSMLHSGLMLDAGLGFGLYLSMGLWRDKMSVD